MAWHGYYPEMGEQPRPDATIEETFSMGRHHYIRTRLLLAGRGIEYLRTTQADDYVPSSRHRAGMRVYRVTWAAFDRLCAAYCVSSQMLL